MNKVIINGVEYAPIGKPRPLLADAKVGDLCKRRDGKYVQIIRIDTCHKRPYRYRDNEYGGDERGVTVAGSWICDDNGKRSFDIIATEPLAEVGSAEWALQMMKLGNKVRNSDWDDGTYERSLLYCQLIGETIKYNEGCSAFDVCLSDWEAPYIKNTGWQIYEPVTKAGVPFEVAKDVNERITECLTELGCIEPEPATEPKPEPKYKVGDWVEIEVSGVISQQLVKLGVFADSINAGGIEFYGNGLPVMKPLNARIIRKLDPSEVIVRIGCLSGTVEKAQDYAYFLLWHSKTDCDYSMIKWSALDAPTRSLVESLLKAQEVKNG